MCYTSGRIPSHTLITVIFRMYLFFVLLQVKAPISTFHIHPKNGFSHATDPSPEGKHDSTFRDVTHLARNTLFGLTLPKIFSTTNTQFSYFPSCRISVACTYKERIHTLTSANTHTHTLFSHTHMGSSGLRTLSETSTSSQARGIRGESSRKLHAKVLH